MWPNLQFPANLASFTEGIVRVRIIRFDATWTQYLQAFMNAASNHFFRSKETVIALFKYGSHMTKLTLTKGTFLDGTYRGVFWILSNI